MFIDTNVQTHSYLKVPDQVIMPEIHIERQLVWQLVRWLVSNRLHVYIHIHAHILLLEGA